MILAVSVAPCGTLARVNGQLFVRCRSRKRRYGGSHTCSICGCDIVAGEEVWRPLTEAREKGIVRTFRAHPSCLVDGVAVI